MSLAQGGLAGLHSLGPLIVVLAIVSVFFWRAVLRIVAVLLVALFLSGAFLIIQDIQHA